MLPTNLRKQTEVRTSRTQWRTEDGRLDLTPSQQPGAKTSALKTEGTKTSLTATEVDRHPACLLFFRVTTFCMCSHKDSEFCFCLRSVACPSVPTVLFPIQHQNGPKLFQRYLKKEYFWYYFSFRITYNLDVYDKHAHSYL